ncbi:hypothetical protein CRG98_044143 [Punica granatum]|uniref:Uncharacterized protein n=1 Tax=Punica granatum TaxID=22663 RepID=A0A2I0HUS6_PUNGR|nr:hypothetical protein CRG98_044143 [Punica granatum]
MGARGCVHRVHRNYEGLFRTWKREIQSMVIYLVGHQKPGVQQGHSGNNGQAFLVIVAEGKSDCVDVKVSVILRDQLSRKIHRDLEGNELFSLGGLNRC